MVSFVIISSNKENRVAYAKDFCLKQEIDRFDITLIEKDTAKDAKLSIGIEEVKQMQRKILLKPIKSKNKAVIIEDAHLLTKEAQNALLKVLEEPPANTIMILGSQSQEALLPTILSRCQVIALEEEKLKLTEKQKADLIEFIAALPEMKIGDKLKKAELLAKDKEKALAWVEKIIIVLREDVHNSVIARSETTRQSHIEESVIMIQTFQKLHTTLKTTNVNPRFAIEATLIQLSI